MPAHERTLAVVRGWVEKAESDLTNATIALGAGKACPADTVAFHAQQSTEKYLKAFLAFRGLDFPRTHDIGELIALMGTGARVQLSVQEQRQLTSYGTVTRYPGDYEPITVAEARRAVALARRVRTAVRKLLPKDALSKERK